MAYDWGRGGSGALSGAAAGSSFGPWGAAAGGALGLLGGFGESPEDQAKKYYDQIAGTLQGAYNPYINAGQKAMGQLQGQYGNLIGGGGALQDQYKKLMNDPGGMLSQIGSGYKESPGYQWQLGQGEAAINNANAAGGMAGTQQHMQQAGGLANNLANQDYQSYLQNALGLYGTGLQGGQGMYNQGLAGLQGINQMGYGASGDLATGLSQALMSQGNLAYAGGNNQDQRMGGAMGNFFGAFGDKGRTWGG